MDKEDKDGQKSKVAQHLENASNVSGILGISLKDIIEWGMILLSVGLNSIDHVFISFLACVILIVVSVFFGLGYKASLESYNNIPWRRKNKEKKEQHLRRARIQFAGLIVSGVVTLFVVISSFPTWISVAKQKMETTSMSKKDDSELNEALIDNTDEDDEKEHIKRNEDVETITNDDIYIEDKVVCYDNIESDRNTVFRFIIEEPYREVGIDYDGYIFRKALMYDIATDDDLEDIIGGVVKSKWLVDVGVKRKNVDKDVVTDSLGHSYTYYNDLINSFDKKKEDAAGLELESTWKEAAPKSSELDVYIDGLEELNDVVIGNEAGCFLMNWNLALRYQEYGIEYDHQELSDEIVAYYYLKSINRCMLALEYEADRSNIKIAYRFLKERYSDLLGLNYFDDIYNTRVKRIYDKLEEMEGCFDENDRK